MTVVRLPKEHELHDKLASTYYQRGSTPREAIDALKSVNYIVKGYQVDAITVANILRGMYLPRPRKVK